MKKIALPLALALAACTDATVSDDQAPVAAVESASDRFFASLSTLCGKAYEGRVVSNDAADEDMRGSRLVMHVRECSDDTIRIPFHVGEDRSRTWVVSRTADGLRLKHDHRHADGTEDTVTGPPVCAFPISHCVAS